MFWKATEVACEGPAPPATPASLGAPGQTPLKTEAPVQVKGATDPAARLDDMAIDHIGMAALYPTFGLMIYGFIGRRPKLKTARA